MKEEPPSGRAAFDLWRLAGLGWAVVSYFLLSMLVGYALYRWFGWGVAIPVALLVGFIAAMVSIYRQVRSMF